MAPGFKRVPAVDKCFAMIDLLVNSGRPLRISQLAERLGFNKSTVFNLAHTLVDLGVLENIGGNFNLGLGFYLLAKASRNRSDLISVIHPFLERICAETNLTVFLGMRSGLRAVILDRADSPVDLKISSNIGKRIPVLAGAAGKALLCQMPEEELDALLAQIPENDFFHFTRTSKAEYKDALARTRREGIATDYEEYLVGISALAVPLFVGHPTSPLAIWAVGLRSQIKDRDQERYTGTMKEAAQEIRANFVP